ncbi:MAG: hypothetical protein U5N26_10665 [Candidatus Marinimicrobia bacterium]|nr:hypothetical protein [Candidatus Neomarinimicrobiota bacterium]
MENRFPGTPLARRSARRIAAIETHISNYLAYLEGDSLKFPKATACCLQTWRTWKPEKTNSVNSTRYAAGLKVPGAPVLTGCDGNPSFR